MLENIRKYTWLMAAVFILLAAALLFTLQESNATLGGTMDGSPKVMTAYDGTYTQKQVDRQGNRALSMAQQLGMQDLLLISGGYFEPNPTKFFGTRLIIRKEAQRYGIYPSREDVTNHIKEKVFVDDKGEFNQENYANFIETMQTRLGMGENDIEQLFSDHLSLQKLRDLLSNGIEPSKSIEKALLQDRQQQLTVDRIQFLIDDFKKEISPSEEEIKTYWNEHTDSYMSDEQRKITYLLAKPDFSAVTGDDEAAKNEQRETIKRELGEKVDQLWQIAYDTEMRDFKGEAAKLGFEVKSTELFTQKDAPAAITLPLRASRGETAVTRIFAREFSEDPQDRLSDALPVGQDQWLIFSLEEVKKPVPLEFDAAKEKAKTDLIEEQAREAMSDASKKAEEILQAAVDSGKDFATAAKEANLDVVKLGPFSARDTLPQDSNARTIFFNSRRVNEGKVSDLISEPEENPTRMLLLHVEKRELVKSDSFDEQVDSSISASKSRYGFILFQNWINEKFEQYIQMAGSPQS